MPRGLCTQCLQPLLTCYCQHLRPFDPKIRFVILIHGREAKKRLATGRLSYLSLQNAELIQGYDYSEHPRVDALLNNPKLQCTILYPGEDSLNLSECSLAEKQSFFPREKELVVFVVDGTWITARKTMQRSTNLQRVPRISFTPGAPSRFRVRKQPEEFCYSTVEAIHQTIELLGDARGFSTETREHDHLLQVFDTFVEQQLVLANRPKTHCLWSARR